MDGALTTVERLVAAVNAHDLEGVASCFADDYVNETPVHPLRGFRGKQQVETNWTRIFAGVPDIHARITSAAVDRQTVWTEWEMSGTRFDEGEFLMRGVVIFTISATLITSARFYLEPVEHSSGDVDAHTRRVVGINTHANDSLPS